MSEIHSYIYTWLSYYLLATGALGTLLSALWPFKSRIYENGRPMVQEIVLTAMLAGLYLFAGAWQLYEAFSDQMATSRFYLHETRGPRTQFLCPTNNYANQVHCRLWQSQLVGCIVCGIVFAIVTIVWVVLFRRRPLVFKDLPESLKEDEMITSPRMKEAAKRDEQREREEEIAAITAEAERRAALQRAKAQTRPTHPYQQQQQQQQQNRYQQQHQQHPYQQQQQYPVSRIAGPGHMEHRNSASYLNQGYDSRESPLPQSNYSNDGSDAYYNSNYAAQQQSAYEMTPTNQQGYPHYGEAVPVTGSGVPALTGTPLGNPYSDDPLALAGAGYTDANANGYYPVTATSTSQLQQTGYNNEYAYGQFVPDETFDDPSSQEAQAHLIYANQLREQQLYHEQMAEALQKQKQQRALKQQHGRYDENGVPQSGSTTNFLSQKSNMPPISSSSTNVVAGGPPISSSSTNVVAGAPPFSNASTNIVAGGPPISSSSTNFVSGRPPISSSSTNIVSGAPPFSNASTNVVEGVPPISSSSTNIIAGGNSTSARGPSSTTGAPLPRHSSDFASAAYGRPNINTYNLGLITPGSTTGASKIVGSPQLYDDTATVADSQYSYDRYRAEVLGDLRPPNTRSATTPISVPGAPQDLSSGSETAGYHDYKVQVASPIANSARMSTGSSSNRGPSAQQQQRNQAYVPPPTKSRTMWS
ncbi:hypothetical protein BGX23_002188 [Mortierella sp. AD031]|nr:hypothetical protein BGX23_002188 [Mortierella sp. AD031]